MCSNFRIPGRIAHAALVLSPLNAQTEDANNRLYELEDYVVTGTALPLPAFRASSDIASLAGEEKLRRQAANLAETLDHLGGVSAINTELDEETSLGGDLQARWRDGRLDWTATAYVTAFSDYVTVKNATDEDYRDFLDTYKGYALSPGRNVVVQTSLAF